MSVLTFVPKLRTSPFLQVLGGVLSDYVTTTMGLSMGFCETNLEYNPVVSLLVFFAATAILTLAVPRKRPWNLSFYAIGAASYLGAINNVLVMLGLLSG